MLSDYRSFYFDHGVIITKSSGGQLIADCLFCGKTQHLYISEETGQYHCKACDARGNAITFLMKQYPLWTKEQVQQELNRHMFGKTAAPSPEKKFEYPDITGLRDLGPDEVQAYCTMKRVDPVVISIFRIKHLISNGQECVAIPAWSPDSPNQLRMPTCWIRDRIDGQKFVKKDGSECKYPVLAKSQHGLIGLPQLVNQEMKPDGKDGGMVLLCEGVRDTLRAASLGYTAVSTSGGCGHWNKSFNQYFTKKHVYIIYDRDKAGVECGRKRAADLYRDAGAVYLVELPYELADSHGKDLSDFLDDGHDIKVLLASAVAYVPDAKTLKDLPPDHRGPKDVPDGYLVEDTFPQTLAKGFWEEVGKVRKLRYWKGLWVNFQENRYVRLDHDVVAAEYRRWQISAWHKKFRPKEGDYDYVKIPVTERTTRDVLAVLSSLPEIAIDTRHTAAPFWLSSEADRPNPINIIPLNDCLLDISDGKINPLPLTEDYFTLSYVPINYNPDARCPRWLQFVDDKCTHDNTRTHELVYDIDSVNMLQEYFGLCMVPDTRYHKVLGLIGVPRSGKSTTAHILRYLVGLENFATTNLQTLSNGFGLEPLIGKTVACIWDTELAHGRASANSGAVEIIKNISGEDPVTVNIKHKRIIGDIDIKVRFVMLANRLIQLHDPSGALASRFLFLKYSKSYYEKEDHNLQDQLVAELPGILNWAIDGLIRLRKRGRFVEPIASKEMRAYFLSLTAPLQEFLRDCCVVGDSEECRCQEIYLAYEVWCRETNHKPMSKTHFYSQVNDMVANFEREKKNNVWTVFGVGLQYEWQRPELRGSTYTNLYSKGDE